MAVRSASTSRATRPCRRSHRLDPVEQRGGLLKAFRRSMERAPLDLIGDEGVRQRQNLDQIMLHRIEPLRPSRRGRRRLSESESPIGGSIKRETDAWLAGRGEGLI